MQKFLQQKTVFGIMGSHNKAQDYPTQFLAHVYSQDASFEQQLNFFVLRLDVCAISNCKNIMPVPSSAKVVSYDSHLHILQAAPQLRLSHDILRKHTEMNEQHSSNAALQLVEQVQILVGTHQQLAKQMQVMVEISQQHLAARVRHPLVVSPIVFAVAVALALVLGIAVAKILL